MLYMIKNTYISRRKKVNSDQLSTLSFIFLKFDYQFDIRLFVREMNIKFFLLSDLILNINEP